MAQAPIEVASTFFWVFSRLIGVSGVKSAFFWAFLGVFLVFLEYHGFFWVFSGLIGIFSPPIQWPGFQIDGESAAWVSNRRRGWWVW